MEKNSGGRREGIGCLWVFISIFGSNHKRLLMDYNLASQRFKGTHEKNKELTCPCESDQTLIGEEEHVVDESEEKFSEMIKRLIAQKEGEIQTCKDLLEAFHVLDSKEEEEEEESLLKKISHESLGDCKRIILVEEEDGEKQEVVVSKKKKKHHNFFRRKWRSEERRSKSQASKSIVVLKPSPSTTNKSKNGTSFSRFLFGLIKRRQHSSVGNKSCDVLVEETQSESKKHVLYNEEEEEEDTKKRMSSLYIAAKKHLSEMLANGDIDVNLPDQEVPRILGKILSLPEFSSSPSTNSPPTLIPEEEPKTLTDEEGSDEQEETLCTINISVPEDHEKETDDIVDTAEMVKTEPLSQELNSPPDSPPSSSQMLSQCNETATDVQGKLSPVSVLEPLFTDDDSSSSPTTSTRLSSGMYTLQPLSIRFDEPDSPKSDNKVQASMDDKEATLAYIESVVKSSGLNWEELLKKPYYSSQLLEKDLTEDIAFSSTELCDDKNLLNDCINEVLIDFCENELNPGPLISFVKPEVLLISENEVAAKVAQEGVYWHLQPLPSPHTLDQIVSKDMARPGSWMDLRFDIGCICSGTSEMILDDLVEEIIRSFRDQNNNNLS